VNSQGAAFAQIAAALAGETGPGMMPTVAQCIDRLRAAAVVLRQHGGDETRPVADAIETWLQGGGDLRQLLGVKVGRGRSADMPHRASAKAQRDALVIGLADRLKQRNPGLSDVDAARLLALLIRNVPGLQPIVREHIGTELPVTEKSVRLILRT
jgi:hypothetical protein